MPWRESGKFSLPSFPSLPALPSLPEGALDSLPSLPEGALDSLPSLPSMESLQKIDSLESLQEAYKQNTKVVNAAGGLLGIVGAGAVVINNLEVLAQLLGVVALGQVVARVAMSSSGGKTTERSARWVQPSHAVIGVWSVVYSCTFYIKIQSPWLT